jgi:hypothetical protein
MFCFCSNTYRSAQVDTVPISSRLLDRTEDADSYKQISIGKSKFDRYSQKAISEIKKALEEHSIDQMWKTHGIH